MPPAQLASAGALCAVHPVAAAATVCSRCGNFMCGQCSLNNQESMCLACRTTSGFDVNDLGRAYKSLVLWFGAQLLLSIANGATPAPLKAIFSLGVFVTLIPLTIYAYRTAKALGSNVAWLWGALMFIPCANAITLLVLSSKATAACKERGIAVGFFGPKL